MILQSLNDLYSRIASDPDYEIAPPGFSNQKISFRIVVKPDGNLFEIEDARKPNSAGKLMPTVISVPGETKPSGPGINPCFLWDNQTYLLGMQPENKQPDFGKLRFESFRDLHLANERQISDPDYSAICRFLESWDPLDLGNFPILNEVGTGFGIFQIQGSKKPVHENKKIESWWKQRVSGQGDSETISQCMVTGVTSPIARLHPKIKGVAGAQSVGASIVSFNNSAYESYGKTQSFNSPVSEKVAFQYGAALNSLLNGPKSDKHRISIGGTTVVFWTDGPQSTLVESCFAEFVGGGSSSIDDVQDQTQRERLLRLLSAVKKGGHFQDFDDNLQTGFYILGLAPNAARLAVRFFHRSSIGELIGRLHDHLNCFKMVREFDQPIGAKKPDPEFPALWQILRETARTSKEISPLLGGGLTRSVIEGTPYPDALLTSVIRRIQADRRITYLRAATIKASLVRNHNQPIPIMLDTTNTEPAYRLGRLFSALEKTQDDALGNVNAGIRDRFYGAASATPASVFPRLLRTYQHHLSKLTPGLKVQREQLIQEILESIQVFPSQLNLKRQGMFAIGYYHQRKSFFTKKQDPVSEPLTTAES